VFLIKNIHSLEIMRLSKNVLHLDFSFTNKEMVIRKAVIQSRIQLCCTLRSLIHSLTLVL
jgi:hypothetical protein